MKPHGATRTILTIDTKTYTVKELVALTGFTRGQIANWIRRGYFDKMIPAIKRQMEKINAANASANKRVRVEALKGSKRKLN